jgi:hypothetical protein
MSHDITTRDIDQLIHEMMENALKQMNSTMDLKYYAGLIRGFFYTGKISSEECNLWLGKGMAKYIINS